MDLATRQSEGAPNLFDDGASGLPRHELSISTTFLPELRTIRPLHDCYLEGRAVQCSATFSLTTETVEPGHYVGFLHSNDAPGRPLDGA